MCAEPPPILIPGLYERRGVVGKACPLLSAHILSPKSPCLTQSGMLDPSEVTTSEGPILILHQSLLLHVCMYRALVLYNWAVKIKSELGDFFKNTSS